MTTRSTVFGPLLLASSLVMAACSSTGGTSTAPTTTTATTTTTAAGGASVSTSTSEAATTTQPAATTTAAVTTTTAAATATISGTAYTFNTPDPIVGATIGVEELAGATTTTGRDGSYTLTVPAGATVTPYIVAKGHHSIRLQTFTLDAAHDGDAVRGANFQTPTDAIYAGLKALVGGFTGKDPFAGGACVIVTTVGSSKLVGMDFAHFIQFHPHGVPGAVAHIDPAKATAVYFNDQVLPDSKQKVTSVDGGVLWPNVPPGTYTLTATKAGASFATVHVRCEAGWVVNANPVWGLHELP